MKRILLTLLSLVVFLTIFSQPTGRVVSEQLTSQVLTNALIGEPSTQPIAVYLPPSYDISTAKHYPVVYFFCGHGETINNYVNSSIGGFRLLPSLNTAITNGQCKELIMVIVNSYNVLTGSFFANSPVIGNWEDFVVNEVISHVDNTYRTIPNAGGRAIIGFSMGGYGSLNLSMRHPSVYSAAVGYCPGVAAPGGMAKTSLFDNNNTIRNVIAIINKYKNMSRAEAHQQYLNSLPAIRSGDWTIAFSLGYASAFAPDTAANAPYIKYPYTLDANNNLVKDPNIFKLYETGFGNMEEKVSTYKDSLLKLNGYAIDYATNDGFSWIPEGCIYYDDILTQYDIPHTVWTNTGGHGGTLAFQLTKFHLPFCDTLLQFDTVNLSAQNEMLGIKVTGLATDPVIDAENHTITLLFKENANLTNVKPAFTISPGADIEPNAYEPIDLTSGEAKYKITSEDGTQVTEWTIKSSTTNIGDDQGNINELNVVPNPANGSFQIVDQQSCLGNILIFNSLGCMVFKSSSTNSSLTVDGGTLKPGIYFVRKSDNYSFSSKLVVQ